MSTSPERPALPLIIVHTEAAANVRCRADTRLLGRIVAQRLPHGCRDPLLVHRVRRGGEAARGIPQGCAEQQWLPTRTWLSCLPVPVSTAA